MNLKSVVSNRILGSISAFLIALLFVLWEYFNGGVVNANFKECHYINHSEIL